MKYIYKYKVGVGDTPDIDMPPGPVVHVANLGMDPIDIVTFWVEHSDDATVRRTFYAHPTGNWYDDHYWGTAIVGNGILVWHLMEVVA